MSEYIKMKDRLIADFMKNCENNGLDVSRIYAGLITRESLIELINNYGGAFEEVLVVIKKVKPTEKIGVI